MTAGLEKPTPVHLEFTSRLLKSRRFSELYAEVMDVVERCAAYLDEKGREDRAALPADQQAAFAKLSMWLTASLMRSASVVLVLRAVGRGEMNVDAAMRELEPSRHANAFGKPPVEFPAMPDDLAELRDDGLRIKEATERFVATLFGELPRPFGSPALDRLRELRERLGVECARAS